MIDTVKNKPLTLLNAGQAGSSLALPFTQLARVQQILDAGEINYWVDEFAISIDGRPEVIVINFPRGTDGDAIQQLLDSHPE